MARRRSTSGIGIGGAVGIGVLLVIAFVAQYWVYFAVAAGVGLVLWLFVKWASPSPSVIADRSAGVGTAPSPEARVRTDNQPPQGVRTRDGDAFWVAPDKTARFNGRPIGSFIYVGEGLASADGQRIEPALIDARLPVDTTVTDCTERRTPYWPTYDSITSQARAPPCQYEVRHRPS